MVSIKIEGSSKKELAGKLLIYSTIYGLLMINYIDLITPGAYAYHLWLIIMYFTPFIPLIFVYGLDDYEIVLSLGLLSSLMNDLFYYPIGKLLFGRAIDLYQWYLYQLGFKLFEPSWTFNGGIITFKVTSILMGSSIYARIIVIIILLYKWWNED